MNKVERAMKLAQLRKWKRLDARRTTGLMGHGPDDAVGDDFGTASAGRQLRLGNEDGKGFPFRAELGFYKESERIACELDGADPENLNEPGKYFWCTERKCLVYQDGQPVEGALS